MIDDRLRAATSRLSILRLGTVALFGLLGVGFWVLQVVQHAKFEEMAENNHQRTLPLRAPRGIVFDRNQRRHAAAGPQGIGDDAGRGR